MSVNMKEISLKEQAAKWDIQLRESAKTIQAAITEAVVPRVKEVISYVEPRVQAAWRAMTRQDVRDLEQALRHVVRGGPATPASVQRLIDEAKAAVHDERSSLIVSSSAESQPRDIQAHA